MMIRPTFLRIISVAFLLCALIFFSGFYPIALVNRQVILASDFYTNLAAAKKFYESQKISGESSNVDWKSIEFKNLETNIKSAVLQNLIEDKILISESRQIADINSRINENLGQILSQVSGNLTNEGLSNLYGWDIRTFKTRVLEPEARRKAFFEGFARQRRDFNEWLSNIKYQAHVKIFLSGFAWDSNKGQVKTLPR